MNDDDSLRPINLDEEDLGDLEDVDIEDEDVLAGDKKGKKNLEDEDSLDALAEDEDIILPEDSFDDIEPEDMW